MNSIGNLSGNLYRAPIGRRPLSGSHEFYRAASIGQTSILSGASRACPIGTYRVRHAIGHPGIVKREVRARPSKQRFCPFSVFVCLLFWSFLFVVPCLFACCLLFSLFHFCFCFCLSGKRCYRMGCYRNLQNHLYLQVQCTATPIDPDRTHLIGCLIDLIGIT